MPLQSLIEFATHLDIFLVSQFFLPPGRVQDKLLHWYLISRCNNLCMSLRYLVSVLCCLFQILRQRLLQLVKNLQQGMIYLFDQKHQKDLYIITVFTLYFQTLVCSFIIGFCLLLFLSLFFRCLLIVLQNVITPFCKSLRTSCKAFRKNPLLKAQCLNTQSNYGISG